MEELTTDDTLDYVLKERQNDINRQKIDDEEKANQIIARLEKYCGSDRL